VKSPAVFLDRDGTLIEEVGYLDRLERLQLFPTRPRRCASWPRGFRLVVITNQAVWPEVLRRGFVRRANQHLVDRLADAGVTVMVSTSVRTIRRHGRALPDRV